VAHEVTPLGSADGSVRSRDSEELSRDAGLPVSTLREALPHLRRPFTPEAIRFKVQNVWKGATGCIVVAYIDARLVIERLNAVCGEEWTATPRSTNDEKHMWCELTVFDRTRIDVGQSGKGFSKDLWSDALKRSAVQFGIGVSVYALPEIKLRAGTMHTEQRMKWNPKTKKEEPTLVLTEHGHVKLREGYAKWLEEHGERLFGGALDHGDVEGSTFDDSEQEETEEFVPEAAPPLEDEEAQRLTAEIRALYEQISASEEGRKAIPSGRFNAYLTGAAHSHVELERLRLYLAERLMVLRREP
jgi:hypothetical protein